MNAEGVLKKAEAWRLSSRLLTQVKEKTIESLLLFAALTSVAITVGIVGILVYESTSFFVQISLWEFLTDRQWTPLFSEPHYGILPLVSGTLVTTTVALAVAVPMGSLIAIYLSEYASTGTREVIKPALELLSAVPTVVYGYFALLFVTPALQKFWPELPGFNMLSAGLVIGIMIVPYVTASIGIQLLTAAVPSLAALRASAVGACEEEETRREQPEPFHAAAAQQWTCHGRACLRARRSSGPPSTRAP